MSSPTKNPFKSLKTETASVDPAALRAAVSKQLGSPVRIAAYQAAPLHGGTLGDVRLISGDARHGGGRTLPFRIVLKTQKKWERPGDPTSWRREYDLYQSGFHTLFTEEFRRPQVYHAEECESENRLWMAYIQGVSGAALTLSQLALAAEALGRFQGLCHARRASLQSVACLSDARTMQRDFAQWTPDTAEYKYLCSESCALPPHLRHMLTEAQTHADEVFQAMARLPQVLCHGDYWTENIFVSGGRVSVIDWDCAGWGVVGEDIASLIADETPASQIGAYCQTLLPAYYRALAKRVPLPPIGAIPVREMILFKFGYRFLQRLMVSGPQAEKKEAVRALEAIFGLPPMLA